VIRRGLCLVALVLLATSCRDELHRAPPAAVQPPVSSLTAIPDAPVNGTVGGTPFVLRDARYVVDKRIGYAHTDIKLSTGKSETPCGPISPATSTSVWIRYDGDPMVPVNELRLAPGDDKGPWSVHYQIFGDNGWIGVGEGAAIASIQEPSPDGRLSGGIGVCFSDDKKSCVSGSFVAHACPPTIDQPVRGAQPPEAVPAAFRLKMLDGGMVHEAGAAPAPSSTPSAAPSASAGAPPHPPH
jgi:hypothetical protein